MAAKIPEPQSLFIKLVCSLPVPFKPSGRTYVEKKNSQALESFDVPILMHISRQDCSCCLLWFHQQNHSTSKHSKAPCYPCHQSILNNHPVKWVSIFHIYIWKKFLFLLMQPWTIWNWDTPATCAEKPKLRQWLWAPGVSDGTDAHWKLGTPCRLNWGSL